MTTRNYVLQAFTDTPWAILPAKLALLEEVVVRHANGEKLDPAEIQSRIHGAQRPPEKQVVGLAPNGNAAAGMKVAVLPLFGSIFPRANLMTEMSGATSAEMLGRRFDELVNDASIDAIVLDVDSPGGQVSGVPELAEKIYQARGKKPVVAVANHLMASAAYWIASAVDRIYVSPSADIGSIGVFAAHQDISKKLENDGVKVTLIKAGKHKAEGNPYQPLTEEAAANIQASVDEVYEKFTGAVARHRGVSIDDVKSGFGEGRVVSAEQALQMGMADEIATLDDVIQMLFSGQTPSSDDVEASSTDAGQVPADVPSVEPIAQARFAVHAEMLDVQKNKQFGDPMSENLRKMISAHADEVRKAQALVEVAEEEDRDLTEEEQSVFDTAMSSAEELSQKIESRQELRKRLEAQASKVGSTTSEPEKSQASNAGKKEMTRAEFDVLNSTQKAEFSRNGGKITE